MIDNIVVNYGKIASNFDNDGLQMQTMIAKAKAFGNGW